LRRPFYGWIIVGVSFLIGFTESGVFQNILSIFMKPMVDEFGWSRASVTGAIAFGSLSGGLFILPVRIRCFAFSMCPMSKTSSSGFARIDRALSDLLWGDRQGGIG